MKNHIAFFKNTLIQELAISPSLLSFKSPANLFWETYWLLRFLNDIGWAENWQHWLVGTLSSLSLINQLSLALNCFHITCYMIFLKCSHKKLQLVKNHIAFLKISNKRTCFISSLLSFKSPSNLFWWTCWLLRFLNDIWWTENWQHWPVRTLSSISVINQLLSASNCFQVICYMTF